MQQSVPRIGRNLPGMPLEMENPDGDEEARPGVRRFSPARPARKWWRPASAAGRIFLTLGALVVLGGLTASALMLRTYLERDARFRIAGAVNIQAAGLTEMSRSQMLAVFGEDIGRNVFFVPLDERRRELEAIPWVERATVMRLLPDQIRVSVVERQPVAFTRQGQMIGLVDADGVLLSMPAADMARHHYSFPVVTGIDPGDPAGSRQARMAVYQRLMGDLDSNGQHLSEQISEIDLTDPEDARVFMPEQRYQAHIAEWRQQYPHLAAVDLRYDQQAVLEMASGKEASETTPGAAAAAGAADAKPPAGEPAGETSANAKPSAEAAQKKSPGSSAAKARTAPDKKKRVDAGHTALNDIRRNPAHATRHAAAAAEGQ